MPIQPGIVGFVDDVRVASGKMRDVRYKAYTNVNEGILGILKCSRNGSEKVIL